MNDVLGKTMRDIDAVFAASKPHSVKSTAQRKLEAIVREYERCKDDPAVRIPTSLMCLLEAARE